MDNYIVKTEEHRGRPARARHGTGLAHVRAEGGEAAAGGWK